MTIRTPAQVYLLGALSAGCLALALKAPKLISWPALALLPAAGLAAYGEGRRYRLSDYIAEGLNIGTAIATLGEGDSRPPALLTHLLLPADYKADWDSSPADQVDPTTADFWTAKRALASKIICGIRGSGKTSLSAYFAGQLAKTTRLLISDRHYPAGDAEWLPGVPREDFEQRYLISDAAGTLNALLNFKTELGDRISGESDDKTELHLLIDEWGGCWRAWSDGEQAAATEALGTINEEGRKFGVNVTLIVHNLLTGKTGLGQELTGAADLYLMGDALSFSNYSFPTSLTRQRDSLTGDRLAQLSAIAIKQRVIIFRDAQGDARLIVAPDLSEPERFEVDDSLSDERLAQLWIEGHTSTRKLCEALNIQRKTSNPAYALVKTFVAGKTTPPT